MSIGGMPIYRRFGFYGNYTRANDLYLALLAIQNAANNVHDEDEPANRGIRAKYRLDLFPPNGLESKSPSTVTPPHPPHQLPESQAGNLSIPGDAHREAIQCPQPAAFPRKRENTGPKLKFSTQTPVPAQGPTPVRVQNNPSQKAPPPPYLKNHTQKFSVKKLEITLDSL